MQSLLMEVYKRLFSHYGSQNWWPGEGIEIAIGAVLTQQVSWKNVERALSNLKQHGCMDLERIIELPLEQLENYIKPAIYYKQKARTLKNLAALLINDPEPTRESLLKVPGIGPETADSILLYLYNKPYFVVDAYTKRIFSRLGLDIGKTYNKIQKFFMQELPRDTQLYNEYHALIVEHGKTYCKKNKPKCNACPLLDLCKYGKNKKMG